MATFDHDELASMRSAFYIGDYERVEQEASNLEPTFVLSSHSSMPFSVSLNCFVKEKQVEIPTKSQFMTSFFE